MVTIAPMEHLDHSRLIDELGGTTSVARLCNVEPQAVSKWKREGIPGARMQFLQAMFPEKFGLRRRNGRLVPAKRTA